LAPSDDKGGAEKYNNLPLEELKAECKRRNIAINESNIRDDLIAFLFKDDTKPTDWAKIYARLLYHTGMHYEEIAKRTLPQINALLGEADENISIKIGMPNIFGGASSIAPAPPADGKPPKVSQFAALAGMFGGIH
jgi:hypothetical protein